MWRLVVCVIQIQIQIQLVSLSSAWPVSLVCQHRQSRCSAWSKQRPLRSIDRFHRPAKVTSDDADSYRYVNRASAWSVIWTLETDDGHHPQLSRSMQEVSEIDRPSIRFIPLTESATTEEAKRQRHAAETTWNWCAHFVARHELCPWAEASVQDPNAIRIYTVHGIESETQWEAVIEAVATNFANELERKDTNSIDPSTAICFVVLVPPSTSTDIQSSDNNSDWYTDFASYHDWFVDFEEQWPLVDQVTLAPFHPEWKYEGDEATAVVELEKQSPWPTVSIVSTSVLDKAGPAATQRIADNNQAILMSKSKDEWKNIYNATVLSTRKL